MSATLAAKRTVTSRAWERTRAGRLPSGSFGVRSDTVEIDLAEGLGEHREVRGEIGRPHPRVVHPEFAGGEVDQPEAELGVVVSSIHARSRKQYSIFSAVSSRLAAMKLYA